MGLIFSFVTSVVVGLQTVDASTRKCNRADMIDRGGILEPFLKVHFVLKRRFILTLQNDTMRGYEKDGRMD